MTDTAPDPTTLITEEMVEKATREKWDRLCTPKWDTLLLEHRKDLCDDTWMLLKSVVPDIVKAERDRLEVSEAVNKTKSLLIVSVRNLLRQIERLGKGPDKGSAQWQIDCAVEIAATALAEIEAVTRPPRARGVL